jgi:hypothetical protein
MKKSHVAFLPSLFTALGGTMSRRILRGTVRGLLIAFALAVLAAGARAQTPVESSLEIRFQLDFHVSDAALQAYLPQGWTSMVATQGPAKDCNIRAVFIDRLSVNGPDGKPVGTTGTNRLAYLVAPVKDANGEAVQLVISGITEDPADAPGPFGVYLPATTHTVQRSTSGGTGPMTDSQDWVFTAATGEHLEMHIKFERGSGVRSKPADVKFYSVKNPGSYQISRQEQVLDILRNTTTMPRDRVKEFTFKASGGSYDKLFEGSPKALSWDDIIWINRTVMTP